VTAVVEGQADAPLTAPAAAASPWPTRLLVLAIVAVTVSPIVVAALSLIGDSWYPVGDLSHIYFRVGQVGTTATPLVGAESIKGWAHPGPAEFWLAAPLYRLTGADARSLLWTAATINVVAVAGIAAVAWRRGGFPLLVGLMTMVGILIHTLGPERVTSIWNPFLPLLPFLLTVVLAWDVGLGNRRSLLWLGIAATVAAQTHFAYLTLCGLLVAGLVAWTMCWRRLPEAPPSGDGASAGPASASIGRGDLDGGEPPGPPWEPWRRSLARAAAVVVVLWLPVVFDALFDLHNPLNIAKAIVKSPPTVGPVDAVGIVSRYMRPDGPWIGGGEPVSIFSVRGSGPLALLLALAVLGGCLWLATRHRLVDVMALATLSLVLVVGSVSATSQIVLPVYSYLTQFLKLVGALVWFTVAWTVWRVATPRLERGVRRTAVAAAAGLAVVGTAAWTWGDATSMRTPNPTEGRAVQAIRQQLDDVLPRDETLRVEHFGDYLNIPGPGVIYWLIHDGFDVLTSDGDHGLKWGHEHRWQKGEHSDRTVTVASYYTGSFWDPIRPCHAAPRTELIAHYDPLTPDERAWLDDMRLAALGDGPEPSAADRARVAELADKGPMISVFEGPKPCARKPKDL
jgi:hypothetical protein